MAVRFDALNRLWGTVRTASHEFRPSTDVFPILDIEKVSHALELSEKGAENGSNNRPEKNAQALDDVEQQIIARIEEERKTSYQTLEDQFHTFSDRLRNLDFQGQFGLIQQANYTSLSDFKAEVTVGEDELHGLRRDLKVAEDELDAFKEAHGLRRAAKVAKPAMTFFKVSLVVLLLLVETVLNGSFLAKGNQQGLVGGVTQAFTFALLNIGVALFLAFFGVRQLAHRSVFRKLIGLIALGAYFAFAVALNLALAHFRELSETLFTDVGREVMQRVLTDPLGLSDLNSWTLFGIGLLFSVVAFTDGCLMTDPYPGFAGTQKRVRAAREEYVDRKNDLIENLKEIRDDHNEKVEAIIRDLSQRRAEHQAIIAHRTRVIGLFAEHQNQLERSANALLTVYREANRRTRTEPEPKYFKNAYKMERLVPNAHAAEEWNDKELADRINDAQKELSEQMRKISVEFEEAVQRYHQLDKLFPGA